MNKISRFQLFSFFFSLSITIFLGVGSSKLINVSQQDVWISVILGIVLGSFLILIINYSFNRIKKENVPKFYKILLLLFAFFLALTDLQIIEVFISNLYLSKTPNLLIILPFVILAILLVNKGIETIGRVSEILFFMSLFLIFLGIISFIPSVDINNYYPLFQSSIYNIIKGALFFAFISTTPVSLLLIINKDEINKPLNYNFIYYYLFVSLTIGSVIIMTAGILGPTLGSMYRFPEYLVLKKLEVASFIEKIENVIAIHWIFNLFVFLTINLLFVKRLLNDITSSKKVKGFTYYGIILLLIYLVTIFLENNPLLPVIFYNYVPYIIIILFFLYPLVAFFISLKKH